jgi:predicted AAA+ superfamily ATPase
LPAWKRTRRRKPIAASKYYFFDVGVVTALQSREGVRRGTPEYGQAFETYIMHELLCWRDYRSGDALSHWRSTSGFEVDFIVGDHTAIEAKSKANVSDTDLKSLRALAEENAFRRLICVCMEPRRRTSGAVQIVPFGDFLIDLWNGAYS